MLDSPLDLVPVAQPNESQKGEHLTYACVCAFCSTDHHISLWHISYSYSQLLVYAVSLVSGLPRRGACACASSTASAPKSSVLCLRVWIVACLPTRKVYVTRSPSPSFLCFLLQTCAIFCTWHCLWRHGQQDELFCHERDWDCCTQHLKRLRGLLQPG